MKKSKSPRRRSSKIKRRSPKRRSPKRRSPKSRSPKRRSRVRIPVKKGILEGYSLSDLARDRRKLLMYMIKNKHATYSDIIKRLNVLVIYNKNRHPDISDKVYRDLVYMQHHVPDIYKLSPVSRSKTTSPYKFKKPKKTSKRKSSKKRR